MCNIPKELQLPWFYSQLNLFWIQEEIDEFDTTIQGPWMKKWEIVHVNRHVERHREMEDNPESWTKA